MGCPPSGREIEPTHSKTRETTHLPDLACAELEGAPVDGGVDAGRARPAFSPALATDTQRGIRHGFEPVSIDGAAAVLTLSIRAEFQQVTGASTTS